MSSPEDKSHEVIAFQDPQKESSLGLNLLRSKDPVPQPNPPCIVGGEEFQVGTRPIRWAGLKNLGSTEIDSKVASKSAGKPPNQEGLATRELKMKKVIFQFAQASWEYGDDMFLKKEAASRETLQGNTENVVLKVGFYGCSEDIKGVDCQH